MLDNSIFFSKTFHFSLNIKSAITINPKSSNILQKILQTSSGSNKFLINSRTKGVKQKFITS